MKRRVLFVITSSTNMGDLALCKEWVADLGQETFEFGFVLAPDMAKFLGLKCYAKHYHKDTDVKHTILAAASEFGAEAIIFATNAFWNLPGYTGVQFGTFVLNPEDVTVPVLSFDPFEIGFTHRLPQNDLEINFSAAPDWVYALRYMSRKPLTPNARHFRSTKIFSQQSAVNREDILGKWGGDPEKQTVVFPISKDRYLFIKEHYPDYYTHLAKLFARLDEKQVQVAVVLPEKVEAFSNSLHIIQLPFVPYQHFLDLVRVSDLYLTDSFVSCIVSAFQMETPAVLLTNTKDVPPAHSDNFMGGDFFKYAVFPYGMYEVSQELEKLFEVKGCYAHCEVFDEAGFSDTVNKLLAKGDESRQLVDASKQWKQQRMNLPSPFQILSEILNATP